MEHTWLIDSGHGGFIGGKYVTAPAKMHTHDDGSVFYEGVFNRTIKNMLLLELEAEGRHYIDTCPTDLDVPLSTRVNIINEYHKQYENAVLISLHSNAGGGTGFEIWTSVGQTRSDEFATLLADEFRNSFAGAPFRADQSDGDPDKESQFYILKNTTCPAILPECLFFDNWSDYQLLIDIDFQKDYVGALAQFIADADTMSI